MLFRSKPSVCSHHWSEQIEELGLKSMQSNALSLAHEVAKTAAVQTASCDCGKLDCIRFALRHELFEHTIWGTFVRQSANADLKLASAEVTLGRYFDHLVSDIWASRYYHSSLGCTLASHRRFLSGCTEDRESLAFQFNLPILGGMDFEHLFRLRQDEAEHFDRFRHALRVAFDERVRRFNTSINGGVIVREIADDVIEPSLRSLRDRLKASERLLNRKAATGLFFGSLATTCECCAGAGPTIAVGAGVSTAVAIASAAATERLEEKRDAELDDFYFLWKALGHKPHQSSVAK